MDNEANGPEAAHLPKRGPAHQPRNTSAPRGCRRHHSPRSVDPRLAAPPTRDLLRELRTVNLPLRGWCSTTYTARASRAWHRLWGQSECASSIGCRGVMGVSASSTPSDPGKACERSCSPRPGCCAAVLDWLQAGTSGKTVEIPFWLTEVNSWD